MRTHSVTGNRVGRDIKITNSTALPSQAQWTVRGERTSPQGVVRMQQGDRCPLLQHSHTGHAFCWCRSILFVRKMVIEVTGQAMLLSISPLRWHYLSSACVLSRVCHQHCFIAILMSQQNQLPRQLSVGKELQCKNPVENITLHITTSSSYLSI